MFRELLSLPSPRSSSARRQPPTAALAWSHRGWHGGWWAARAFDTARWRWVPTPWVCGCAGSADRLLVRPILPGDASDRRGRGLESLFNFVFPPDRRTQS